MKGYLFPLGLVNLVSILIFLGCYPHQPKHPKIQPARIETRPNEKIPYIVLTPEAEKRLGIENMKLELSKSGSQTSRVPRSSILYDENGKNWIYLSLGNQTYHRTEIKLIQIEGENAWIGRLQDSQWPVVTVGAAELLGTESGVGK